MDSKGHRFIKFSILSEKKMFAVYQKKTRQMTLHVHFLLIFETNKSPNESNSELHDG